MIDEVLAADGLGAVMREVRRGRRGELDEVTARAAWGAIAEPGDADAGAVIRTLGAADALRAVRNRPDAMSRLMFDGRSPKDATARWQPRMDLRSVVAPIHAAARVGAELLVPGDDDWPIGVDDLGDHAPLALWVRGDTALLAATPRVAMVGARASSGYGEMLATEFAGELASSGAVIVSGGAYGIDGAAHRSALAVGGATVAVLAGGVDRPYPQGHQRLLHTIAERGAVVSEVPCGTAPTKWRFLARNRLIAAASDATVVIEAGWRSGSLNTAGHAAALGRPLGAVPGPVTSASSAGCHRLLREYDARCVTTAGEIRELWGESSGVGGPAHRDDPDQLRLLDALSTRTAVPVPELARRSGLATERVASLLGLLRLEGRVLGDERGWRRITDAH
ncbi:DNA-processing protein DprA [Streptomyces sp. AC495_CC817]|uniref:DNA-processing protein DprA n=1 Tax=Streptomyces sp. AC495_CC817 TaxID=2823900 RepID=UPI001C268714|nr:DNA-processing protein DprA [Streptomyces sp. AC495_CC817]